jgi:hypothetical protein
MNYLEELDSELAAAGIPARRRRRIVAEFTDHLDQNPAAELGAAGDLARQFADELGTRLARITAYRAFAVLAIAGIALVTMFFDGGRTWGAWVGYGSHPSGFGGFIPGWWVPLMVLWFVSAQVALAAGSLALLRAWRLRHERVITAGDATVLNRRAAVGLLSGAFTMLLLPATDVMLATPQSYRLPNRGIEVHVDVWQSLFLTTGRVWWSDLAIFGGPLLIIGMLAMLPSVLAATRLRPSRTGAAGDLTADIGPLISERFAATPERIAVALGATIVLVMLAVGARSDDALDGLVRGVLDAGVCMAGFVLLGSYLGLRSSGHTASHTTS